ncbi:MAG: alpha/beta hydrolase [Holdemanella sp.]|nr:alpha/beta hydrolase [Holdemanella sp.]
MNYMELREKLKRNEDKRDEGLTTPENVERFNDISYGNEYLDVYRPKGNNDYLPVIVSVHGGGWVYGDKERYQYYCMSLVQHGFAVINFNYRLAPEYKYPASIEDMNQVFHWILSNREQYKLDTDNIFALGDSAGGHILGIYANILTNKDYRKNYALNLPDIHFNALAFNCAVTYIRADLEMYLMEELLPDRGTEEEFDLLDVTKYVTSQFPPSFIATSTKDFLQPDSLALMNSFIDYEVPFEFHYFGNQHQLLNHCFNLDLKLEAAQNCNRIECEFFKRHKK